MKLYEPRRGLYWELGVTGDRVVYVEDGEIVTVLPRVQEVASRDAVSFDVRGRDMKARSASAIYRKAAELIHSGKSVRSCWAIQSAASKYDWRLSLTLRDRFIKTILGTAYTSELFGSDTQAEADKIRVLALLLMAEIAKDEQ